MNPVATGISGPRRSARTESSVHDRGDATGFDVALGAAAAAQAPPRAEVPHAPEREPDRRDARDEGHEQAGALDDRGRHGPGPDARTQEIAPPDGAGRSDAKPADPTVGNAQAATQDGLAGALLAGAAMGAAPAVTGAPVALVTGAGAQNAPAPSPAAGAPAASAPPPAPLPAQVPELPAADRVRPALLQAPPAAKGADATGAAATIVTGAGDLAVRVLSSRTAPRSPNAPAAPAVDRSVPAAAAAAAAPADTARVADTARPLPAPVVVVPAEPAPGRSAPAGETASPAATAAATTPATPLPSARPDGEKQAPPTPAGTLAGDASRAARATQPGTVRVVETPASTKTQDAPAPTPRTADTSASAPSAAAPAGGSAGARPAATAATTVTETATDSAPVTPATVASAGSTGTAPRGDDGKPGDGTRGGSSRRDREAGAEAPASSSPTPTPVATGAGTPARSGPAAAPRAVATGGTAALDDPRLEPMRRAADQVTLKFEGEDGLEGRLRITVRGDTVRASILSSDEGTLQRVGGELGTLRRALTEQGFNTARVAVHDTRAAATNGTADTRQNARDGEERRQGEPQRRPGQGRESRQGSGSEQGRQGPREERRSE